jgi:integrase
VIEQSSPAQVKQIWGRLKDVFKWAVARDYIIRNPFDKVLAKPPKIGKSEKNPLTPEEVDTFFAYLREREPFLYPHYRFWLETGLRQGELLGAKWENLHGDRYYVAEQLLRDGTFDSPKEESVGDVALSPDTVEALERFRQGEVERRGLSTPPESGLMFCQPSGKHLCYRSEAKMLGKLLKAAGIESRSPHEVRHSTASLLISDGASIVQVAGQLRHSDPSITLRVYAHLFPRDLRPTFRPKVITAARLAG